MDYWVYFTICYEHKVCVCVQCSTNLQQVGSQSEMFSLTRLHPSQHRCMGKDKCWQTSLHHLSALVLKWDHHKYLKERAIVSIRLKHIQQFKNYLPLAAPHYAVQFKWLDEGENGLHYILQTDLYILGESVILWDFEFHPRIMGLHHWVEWTYRTQKIDNSLHLQ